MKISVSSYSFAQYINKGLLTLTGALKKAHELGFEAMEFIEITGDNPKALASEIKQLSDSLGMKINSYTIGARMHHDNPDDWKTEFERLKKQVEIAQILGVECMRHDVCYEISKKDRSFGLMLPQIAENTRAVTEFAAQYNIKTCSENHGYIAQDSIRMEQLFNAVNHENYGLLVDFGNFVCVDEDIICAVSRLAPYAIHAHAKDMLVYKDTPQTASMGMTRGANRFVGTAIGDGIVPVLQCMKILKRAGYDGYLSIEYEGSGDCIEGIKKGKKNLDSYLTQI